MKAKRKAVREAREWFACVVGKNILTIAARKKDAVSLYTNMGRAVACEIIKVREVLKTKKEGRR